MPKATITCCWHQIQKRQWPINWEPLLHKQTPPIFPPRPCFLLAVLNSAIVWGREGRETSTHVGSQGGTYNCDKCNLLEGTGTLALSWIGLIFKLGVIGNIIELDGDTCNWQVSLTSAQRGSRTSCLVTFNKISKCLG